MEADARLFAQQLVALARICNQELDAVTIAMYDRALAKYGYPAVCAALDAVFDNIGPGSRMPPPAEIRKHIPGGDLTDATISVDVAGRIWGAVSKFGRYRIADAMAYIGEVGEYVVNNNGGWPEICDMANDPDESGIFKAQMRNEVLGALEKAKLGILDMPPTLPSAAQSEGQKFVSNAVQLALSGMKKK